MQTQCKAKLTIPAERLTFLKQIATHNGTGDLVFNTEDKNTTFTVAQSQTMHASKKSALQLNLVVRPFFFSQTGFH